MRGFLAEQIHRINAIRENGEFCRLSLVSPGIAMLHPRYAGGRNAPPEGPKVRLQSGLGARPKAGITPGFQPSPRS